MTHTSSATRIAQVLVVTLLLAACRHSNEGGSQAATEDGYAKEMLQGIWIESETEEVSFRVKGDSVFFPDSTSQPAYFKIVADSFLLGDASYHIEKQSAHTFWFLNRNGDLVKLEKSEDPVDEHDFQLQAKPHPITLGEKVKRDSVVTLGCQRYHWYVTVNPTRYKVQRTSYNDDGVAVENVYYDNIINITLFQGSKRLFSRDFRKQMYAQYVPDEFLTQSVLGDMYFDHIDTRGFFFNATLCIPDGASCYLIETLIGFTGEVKCKLLEY